MSMLTVFLLYCIQAHLQRTPSWTLCVLFIQVQVTPTTPPTGCGIPSVPNRNLFLMSARMIWKKMGDRIPPRKCYHSNDKTQYDGKAKTENHQCTQIHTMFLYWLYWYVWMVIAGIWLLVTNLQCQVECSQNGNVRPVNLSHAFWKVWIECEDPYNNDVYNYTGGFFNKKWMVSSNGNVQSCLQSPLSTN